MTKSIYEQALDYHRSQPRGKFRMAIGKEINSKHDLALAYSPGVAAPCIEIHKNPEKIYDYTSRGNIVAVISNGTAVLGLGNIGAAASAPVMEGKAILFKYFADIDAIPIQITTQNINEFIQVVKNLEFSFGAINLEDIKAPDCFIIEQELQSLMNIPIMHDDQHGTAIVVSAALMNAAEIAGKKLSNLKVVINGAGAAALASIDMLKKIGIEQYIVCDSNGVIYQGREDGMNPWKEKHAINTQLRTLEQAVKGSDVFLGLSVKGALSADMVKSMNEKPIIFALANPDPEILPEQVKQIRTDAIIATGRSDYNNQVNNALCFPYIFKGALQAQAKIINDDMKLAAVKAIAEIAKMPIHSKVSSIYGNDLIFGPEYIIPTPFDPRLFSQVTENVMQAALKSGANIIHKK